MVRGIVLVGLVLGCSSKPAPPRGEPASADPAIADRTGAGSGRATPAADPWQGSGSSVVDIIEPAVLALEDPGATPRARVRYAIAPLERTLGWELAMRTQWSGEPSTGDDAGQVIGARRHLDLPCRRRVPVPGDEHADARHARRWRVRLHQGEHG